MYKIKEIRAMDMGNKPISFAFASFVRWFKAYFVFGYLPISLYLYLLIFHTPKFQEFTSRLTMMSMTYMQNPSQAKSLLWEQLKLLFHDRYMLAILMISIMFFVLVYSFIVEGMRQSCKDDYTLGDTISEGAKKIGRMVIAFLTAFVFTKLMQKFVYTPEMMVRLLELPDWQILSIALVALIFVLLPATLFLPIFVFSDVGPMWAFPLGILKAIVKSFAIYYRNILKYIYLAIVILIILIALNIIYYILYRLVILWGRHNMEAIVRYIMSGPDALKNLIRIVLFAGWVFGCFYVYFSCVPTMFVRATLFNIYPELLGEAVPENAQFQALPDSFFEGQDNVKCEHVPDASVTKMSSASNDSPIVLKNAGDGLSTPVHNHQNNRPFLNEKIGETMFEKFTSNNNPGNPEKAENSNDSEPKGQ
ncbi:MAG: hypothetical protein IKP23_05225 [Elusimicrobiaceae bacterium]|nr:hypothetical protein [Elusimicrobiaceae bacterium]